MATDNEGRSPVGSGQDALDAETIFRCPECGQELDYYSGIEGYPEMLYCFDCLDVAYSLDGNPIGAIT